MATKFNLNRQPVSDDEINSHKDFDKLVKKFKEQSIEKARSDVNFLKNKKITYSTIIAGATIFCTVTYFTVFKNQSAKQTANEKITTSQPQPSKTTTPSSKKSFVAPPVAKLNVPYNTYKVKSNQGGTIKHHSGSNIIIPKNAFVNKQGQDIVGEVEIKYREFHNPAEIIASGIPMTYDTAGVTMHFESAGMMDIKGYQNNEPVYIKPDKTITVEYQSENTKDKYNMYYLDTIAKNWTYLSRDNSLLKVNSSQKNSEHETKVATSEKIKTLEKQLNEIPPKIEHEKTVLNKKVNQLAKTTEPLKPQKKNAQKTQFELDVDYKEFPELAAFKNAVFEVGDENKNFNPKLADITWNSAEIQEGTIKGKNYLLVLKQRTQTEKLIVYPVLTGKNYDDALKLYEAKFNDYKKTLAKVEADKKKLQEEYEAKQAAYLAQEKEIKAELLKEQIRIQQAQLKKMSTTEKVKRFFLVNQFGVYNSDCPHHLPKDVQLSALFVDNGYSVIPDVVYLINKANSTVYSFSNPIISYNISDEYTLCMVANNTLFTCEPAILKTCFAKKQSKIPVKEIDAAIINTADFKTALGI